MMYYTHLAFGLLMSIIYISFFNMDGPLIFVLIALLFSLFPDIDEHKSKIGRKNKIISMPLKLLVSHRGIFHTIYLPIILFAILSNFSKTIGMAMIIGYLSHLLMDALTRRGIRPLYPIINRKINGFIKTNSLSEKILFLIIILLILYLLSTHF